MLHVLDRPFTPTATLIWSFLVPQSVLAAKLLVRLLRYTGIVTAWGQFYRSSCDTRKYHCIGNALASGHHLLQQALGDAILPS